MGFHIRTRFGDGFGVKGPEFNIRVLLKYIIWDNNGEGCRVEIRGSPLINEGESSPLYIDQTLELALDIALKLEKIHNKSMRAKFYIDKPYQYKVYPIKH